MIDMINKKIMKVRYETTDNQLITPPPYKFIKYYMMRAIYLLSIILLFSCGKDKDDTEKTPDLKFDKLVVSLKDANKISTKQILDKLKGKKEGYTLKSIDLGGDNSNFAKVTGTKPNLELELLKAGEFKAKITLEHKSLGDVIAELSVKVEAHLQFDNIVMGISDGNKISTKQILDKLKGDKQGYTLKSIDLEGDNKDFAKVTGTKPNLGLELLKEGKFEAKITLEHNSLDDFVAKLSIQWINLKFDDITVGLGGVNKISTKQILDKLKGEKQGYTIKAIVLEGNNSSFAKVTGTKPNLELELLKAGEFKAKITLENKRLSDVVIDLSISIKVLDINLKFDDIAISLKDGNKLSTKQILDKLKGDKQGYTLKSIDLEGNNSSFAKVTGAKPNLGLEVSKAGSFKAKITLDKDKFDYVTVELSIKVDAPKFTFNKITRTLNDDKIITTEQILAQITDAKTKNYALKSISLSNADFGEVSGTKPNLQINLKKPGKLSATIVLENSNYVDVIINNCEISYLFDITLGGQKFDGARSIIQTSDGGYAIGGYIGGKARDNDLWVVKLNSSGAKVWDKTFGGAKDDFALSIIQTSDGDYVVAGSTESKGSGRSDSWVIKLDRSGTKVWDKTFGDSNSDATNSIVQTSDKGYALTGHTMDKNWNYVFWILKLDNLGTKTWDKTIGSRTYIGNSIVETSDGGYAVAGYKKIFSDKDNHEVAVIKFDKSGNKVWEKKFGEVNKNHEAESIINTSDGGYAVAGYTTSKGAGAEDFWVIKLNSSGSKVWDKTFGGVDKDQAESIIQTADGGYVVAGFTKSKGAGNEDFWVIKLNSSGSKVWDKTFGGVNKDNVESIIQTSDGHYVVAGSTESKGAGNGDMWILKLDSNGDIVGSK